VAADYFVSLGEQQQQQQLPSTSAVSQPSVTIPASSSASGTSVAAGATQFAQFGHVPPVRPSVSTVSSQVESVPFRGLLSSSVQSASSFPSSQLASSLPSVNQPSNTPLFTGLQTLSSIVRPPGAQPVNSPTAATSASTTQQSIPFQFVAVSQAAPSSKQNVVSSAAPATFFKPMCLPSTQPSAEASSARPVNTGLSSAGLPLTSNNSLSGSFVLPKPVSHSTPAPSGMKTALSGLSMLGQPGRAPVAAPASTAAQAPTTKITAASVATLKQTAGN
jgi:hypothetical protein